MSTSLGGAVRALLGLENGLTIAGLVTAVRAVRTPPRRRRAARGPEDRTSKRHQRIAAVIWDNLPFLHLQHAVYALAPRLAAHLDDLARRRDEERRRRRTT